MRQRVRSVRRWIGRRRLSFVPRAPLRRTSITSFSRHGKPLHPTRLSPSSEGAADLFTPSPSHPHTHTHHSRTSLHYDCKVAHLACDFLQLIHARAHSRQTLTPSSPTRASLCAPPLHDNSAFRRSSASLTLHFPRTSSERVTEPSHACHKLQTASACQRLRAASTTLQRQLRR